MRGGAAGGCWGRCLGEWCLPGRAERSSWGAGGPSQGPCGRGRASHLQAGLQGGGTPGAAAGEKGAGRGPRSGADRLGAGVQGSWEPGGRGEGSGAEGWRRGYLSVCDLFKEQDFSFVPVPPSPSPGVGTFLAEAGDGWSFCSLFLGSKVRVRSCFLAVAVAGRKAFWTGGGGFMGGDSVPLQPPSSVRRVCGERRGKEAGKGRCCFAAGSPPPSPGAAEPPVARTDGLVPGPV